MAPKTFSLLTLLSSAFTAEAIAIAGDPPLSPKAPPCPAPSSISQSRRTTHCAAEAVPRHDEFPSPHETAGVTSERASRKGCGCEEEKEGESSDEDSDDDQKQFMRTRNSDPQEHAMFRKLPISGILILHSYLNAGVPPKRSGGHLRTGSDRALLTRTHALLYSLCRNVEDLFSTPAHFRIREHLLPATTLLACPCFHVQDIMNFKRGEMNFKRGEGGMFHREDTLDGDGVRRQVAQDMYKHSWELNRCCGEFALPGEALSTLWEVLGPNEVSEDQRSFKVLQKLGRKRVVHFDEEDCFEHWWHSNAERMRCSLCRRSWFF
jgi:hypothetical protein